MLDPASDSIIIEGCGENLTRISLKSMVYGTIVLWSIELIG